jgi:hypothetical protein
MTDNRTSFLGGLLKRLRLALGGNTVETTPARGHHPPSAMAQPESHHQPLPLDIEFLLAEGAELPGYVLMMLEKMPPATVAGILVAHHRMARIAAEAAPLANIEQAHEFIRDQKSRVDELGEGLSFAREFATLMAALVALSDKHMRIGTASMNETIGLWRLLLGSAEHISDTEVQLIWPGKEQGIFEGVFEPTALRQAALSHVVPPLYRQYMLEVDASFVPADEDEEFMYIFR